MIRPLLACSLVVAVAGLLALRADDWPQWRGPARTGVSQETALLKEWPKDGPPLRWKRTDIGPGYSSPAVVGGKVFIQTTAGNEEFALALDEKTGKDLWKTPIGTVGKNIGPDYPGSRATPTVDGDRLYCLSSAGQLVCLGTDGKARWQKDFVKEFGGKVGRPTQSWAYSESVLIDGDRVVCTPGGAKATVVALNKLTGATLWESAVPGGDAAEYASVMALEVDGAKQYVQFVEKGVIGVDAATGKFLWRYEKTIDPGANIITPVIQGNKVFTAGSRTGGGLVELTAASGGVTAKQVFFDKQISPSIGGAVLVDGHLYGTSGQALFCAEFATGKVKWTERAVGAASLCAADGRLYVRGHAGDVALVEPSPAEYRERGRFKQPDHGKTLAWPHPVVANGGFYLRDMAVLLCYDVRAK
ncbi:MAG: PQQ-binding-like beta-propeller repeat protein [Gemmataceae bacterium]